jgi:hypothetical protein
MLTGIEAAKCGSNVNSGHDRRGTVWSLNSNNSETTIGRILRRPSDRGPRGDIMFRKVMLGVGLV